MKELCIDVRMAFRAGIGTYIRNIVPPLANFFKLRLITDEESISKWPFLNQYDLILTSAPIYSIEEQIKFPFLVPKCDLFWTPHYNIPFSALKSKKRVVTIHDVYHLAFAKTLKFSQRLYSKLMINRAVNISDHIFTISQFSQDEMIKYTGCSAEKISIIPLGVDASYFSEKGSSAPVREKYQLPSNYFLFVSTLAPHKNVDRLISAWNTLLEKFPSWKLVLVGKPGKEPPKKLKDQPSLQKSVLFLGQVDNQDLPALYRDAYATVHPSLYEGFGLSPLEAMSSGCPAIVSKAASLPEVCGDSALYVDPYDIHDIASAMEKIIQDPLLHAELKAKGLRRSQDFTWAQTVEKYAAIMEGL
ncbi:MAG: glycosyltransferase family 4 protein [Verrucomicrobia bacterium]|nr:glycosyltransferase family 4 protein [Verrucomicrobiota bacterium]